MTGSGHNQPERGFEGPHSRSEWAKPDRGGESSPMTVALWPWWKKVPRPRARRRPGHRLTLEWLENRLLLSGTPLTFSAFGTAEAHGFLADPPAFALYRVHLGAGDRLSAAV